MKKKILSFAIIVALAATCAVAPGSGATLPTVNAASVYDVYNYNNDYLAKLVITGDVVNVRSGPGKNYEKIAQVKNGEVYNKVSVPLQQEWVKDDEYWEYRDYVYHEEEGVYYTDHIFNLNAPDWVLIQLDDGQYGWILSYYTTSYISVIESKLQIVNVRENNDYNYFYIEAKGDGVTYYWEYSDDDGETWHDAKAKAASYWAWNVESHNGRQMRCTVSDQYGNTKVVDQMYLSYIDITAQPQNTAVKYGETATFHVAAKGDGLSYRWQIRDGFYGNGNWHNSSVTTDSYSVKVDGTTADREYRCVITDKYGNQVTTDAVRANFVTPEITVQPTNCLADIGSEVTFHIEAKGDDLSYDWQYYSNEDYWWVDYPDKKTQYAGAWAWTSTGVTTADYTTTLTEDTNQRRVRCVVTDKNGLKTASREAVMQAKQTEGVKITSQPADFVGKGGAYAKITVKAEGEGLTYRWELKNEGDEDHWYESKITSDTYAVTLNEKTDGRIVRCIITDKYGNKVYSDTAVMKIAKPQITAQPSDVLTQDGKTVSFKVKATGSDLTYQWQLSDDKGKTWRNSKVTTPNYYTTLTEANNGRQVRCVVSDGYGHSVTSQAATMKAEVLQITSRLTNAKVENGGTASFKVKATGSGLTYQWQLSDDQGKTWRNSSVTTANYYATVTDKNNGRYVRCIVTDKFGNSTKTNVAIMKLK